jgi:CDP-diglyceride synthetase
VRASRAKWGRSGAARILQLILGLVVLYGSLAMFTSAGLREPNALVWAGLIGIGLLTASTSRAEGHLLAGLWVSTMTFALPIALLSVGHVSDPPCPSDHPPLTNSYYCVFPGYPALLAFALALMAVAVVLAVLDFRALLARAGRAPN